MAVKIGSRTLPLPILQGGMGIGLSLDRLAGAVASRGGMGTISTAACGFLEEDYPQDPQRANLRALDRQVRRARELARGAGLVAVNAMVATVQYADSVKTALRAGADAVVSGAGLPLQLPAIAAQVPDSAAALAPIVSSGRAAALICRAWDKRSQRVPDFVVLEGPLAGGHLGFSPQEVRSQRPVSLSALLKEVREALAPWREKYRRDIPVFVAGGEWSRNGPVYGGGGGGRPVCDPLHRHGGVRRQPGLQAHPAPRQTGGYHHCKEPRGNARAGPAQPSH